MKVLYLSYDGLTDPLGQSQILPYLIGLCKHGYGFDVISFEKADRFKQEEETIQRIIAKHDIKWHPQTYHKRPPILSTLRDLFQMRKVSRGLVRHGDIFLVHARSYLAGLIGLSLKKRFDIRFLFDIRGFWADERVDGGLWSLRSPVYAWIYRYFKRKEIQMMQDADHIISLTHAGKEEIVSGNLFKGKANGLDPKKISVIPCAVDVGLFDPKNIKTEEQEQLKEKLEIQEVQNILVYLGSLGTWYLLDEMLIYFKQFQHKHPSSVFLIVTQDDPEHIRQVAERLEIDNDLLRITSSPRTQVPLHLSLGSLGIFFIKPAYSKKASSATKMGEMLAMGLPFVSNVFGDIAKFTTHEEISHGDMKITKVLAEENSNHIEDYKLDTGIDRYSEVYSKLA